LALTTQFSRALDKALERRTDQLRRLIVPSEQGAPMKYTKRIRDRMKKKLMLAASTVLIHEHANKEFAKAVEDKHLRFIKGFGIRDRFDRIYRWARRVSNGPIIYAFWRGKKCLYVGKGKSYRRLKHYEKSIYLIHADCIEVWEVGSKARLPRAECLAIHLFSPRDNKQKKAAKVKWGKRCPICKRHDEAASEIASLLKLKA
jgi:hypothetical protein